MHFSLQLPTHRVDAGAEFTSGAAVGEMARAAEAAGFGACFVTDHPFPDDRWLAGGGHHALDPFVALSFAAAATTRIRLQTHIIVLAYRNPFLTAKAAASLDLMSGGRLILGTAAGYLKSEFAALGADFEHRNEIADESILAIKRAWTGESVKAAGRGFEARGNSMLPRPRQQPHPPIWVGGNSDRALRRAVEHAEGWVPFPTPRQSASYQRTAAIETLDDLARKLAFAREHAERVGRTAPLDVCFAPFGADMHAEAGPDPARLRAQATALEALGVTWMALSVPGDTRESWCAAAAEIGGELAR